MLTVQKEVAERVVARPPNMNLLAASVQFWAEPKIIASIPRTAFSPPPEVDSAVLLLVPRTSEVSKDKGSSRLHSRYYELVRALFKHPRKTIRNNIVKSEPAIPEKVLTKAGINPDDRPQNLSRDDILELAKQTL